MAREETSSVVFRCDCPGDTGCKRLPKRGAFCSVQSVHVVMAILLARARENKNHSTVRAEHRT